MPISILGLDITGEDVHETGLIWTTGDGDLRAWPIPGTLVPLYGTNPPRGKVLMATRYQLDGQPMASDPRLALARQVDILAAKGLYPAGAFELEFFLLANERDADGKVQPARAVLDGRVLRQDLRSIPSTICTAWSQLFLRHLRVAAKAARHSSRDGDFRICAGPVRIDAELPQGCDAGGRRPGHAEAARAGAGAPAWRHRLFHGQADPRKYAGSGMHFHVSLCRTRPAETSLPKPAARRAGRCRCCPGARRPDPARWRPNRSLVLAPHANSWRRFVSQSYAPVAPTWGVNNRSVALRVPAGDAKNRRIEHRPSGVDANPYLIAATVLAGIIKGLEEGLDPGPGNHRNG